jgi:hypothetical protein
MAERFKSDPFPEKTVTVAEVLEQTKPNEPISIAAAEMRLNEILAHITNISRQIEDRSSKRKRPWSSDPHAGWRRAAIAARDELRKEERSLRVWLERQDAPRKKAEKVRRTVKDLQRQEVDRLTRDARRLAKKSGDQPLWDLYLKIEITLLMTINTHGSVDPVGESLLYTAQREVPDWYREQWLHTVYGTTWGRVAEAAIAASQAPTRSLAPRQR